EVNVKKVVSVEGKPDTWQITLENPTDRLAFFLHAKIVNKKGKELLPSYWSDNYISITPHKSRTLEVSLRDAKYKSQQLKLLLVGWNLKPKKIFLNSR
ncbi:MAG TPA: glycoside hydrolase family 2 protein, partial [Balneolaceae bacterium]|nr:glycoside hydrolase family 2 protein [Balneolaceae bacterium]